MHPSDAIRTLLDTGLTQKEVGAAVGAPQSTINRILHGKLVARWDMAIKLAGLATKAKRKRSLKRAA